MVKSLSGLDLLLKEVSENVEAQIAEKSEVLIAGIKKEIEELRKYQLTVVINGTKKHEITGLKHKQLNDLIALVGSGLNVMITGQAGTGKTKSAEQVAEALGLAFYCMSVGSQTSKSDLLGYMDANGKYVSTIFRQAYEKGGVFVMDEIDAGNSNVLIVLNSALSNGLCAFPDGMVKKHDDFRFVATANTYGNGADRVYVGRNQLDGATLDRFATIDWKIDEKLETAITPQGKYKDLWLAIVRGVRKEVEKHGLRMIISPRASVKGVVILEATNGNFDLAFEACVKPQCPQDKIETIKKKFNDLKEKNKGLLTSGTKTASEDKYVF